MASESELGHENSILLSKKPSEDIELSSSTSGLNSPTSLNSPASPTSKTRETKAQRKKKEADQVSKQTEAINTPGTIWNNIKIMDLRKTLALIKEHPEKLEERGPVGETPLHLCFLLHQPGHLEIAKKIIELEPKIVTAVYEHPIYQGETVLHMAIVNKDMESVKWLVEANKTLLSIPAIGKFFQGDSPCYYGEYPLAFAACTNNIPMVKYLLLQGANLFQADSSGNTILHILVIHECQRMFSYILEKEKEIIDAEKKEGHENKERPLLSKTRNKEGLTPLLLAAQRGQKEMFEFIFDKLRENQWTYGPVACNIYPLEEVDTLQPISEEDLKKRAKDQEAHHQKTALGIVVREKHLDILSSSRMVDLLNMKWKSYAGKAFRKRCWGTFVYVVCLTCAVICRSPYFYYDFTQSQDIGRLIAEIIVLLGWIYKGKKEATELYGNGWSYFTQDGSAFLENTLSFTFLISLPIAVFCQAGDNQEIGTPNVPAMYFTFISIMASWTYLLTLLLGFQLTGMFVIMLWKMFTTDVVRFGSIYLLVLVGHSVAFYAIEDPTATAQFIYPANELGSDFTWFKEFWWRLEKDFYVLLGQIAWEDFEDVTYENYHWLADLLLLFHVVFCTIMLLNMLIAMIGDTFAAVKENAFQEWTLAYAQIIASIESEMSTSKQMRLTPYWAEIGGKRYLQIMDTNKDYYRAQPNEEKELMDLIKTLDLNNDGIITEVELKIGDAVLKRLGKIPEEPDDGFRAQKDHIAVLDSSNIGAKDHLTGRLAPELTAL